VLQNIPTFVSFALTRTLGLIAVPLATASNALKLAQEEIPSVALKHTLVVKIRFLRTKASDTG
jgi:hypothetical protein